MPKGGDRRASLLVRNLSLRTSPEDVREVFERYGSIKDVYMPRDHYTKEPKGFCFCEFHDERDAHDALDAMDRKQLDGREVQVVFAQERRKSPDEMRNREPAGADTGYKDRRSGRDRSRSRGRGGRDRSRSRGRGGRDRSRSRERGGRDRSRSPRRR